MSSIAPEKRALFPQVQKDLVPHALPLPPFRGLCSDDYKLRVKSFVHERVTRAAK